MPRKVYTNSETPLYFLPDGIVAESTAFNPVGLPDGSGYKSDVRDLGEFPRASNYRWRAKFANDVTESINLGGTLEFYWASYEADTELDEVTGYTDVLFGVDGSFGSGEGMFSDIDSRRNTQWIGSVESTVAGSGEQHVFASSGYCQLFGKKGMLITVNNTGAKLTADESLVGFSLIPVPDEIQ